MTVTSCAERMPLGDDCSAKQHSMTALHQASHYMYLQSIGCSLSGCNYCLEQCVVRGGLQADALQG